MICGQRQKDDGNSDESDSTFQVKFLFFVQGFFTTTGTKEHQANRCVLSVLCGEILFSSGSSGLGIVYML